ncbi:MAG: hypothetical protein HIU89_13105 [Proteobacteria bacterium]|nr:hypothetical protein [Pseudomonadota bacterium]
MVCAVPDAWLPWAGAVSRRSVFVGQNISHLIGNTTSLFLLCLIQIYAALRQCARPLTLNASIHGDVAQRQNRLLDRFDCNPVRWSQNDCVIPVGVAVLDVRKTYIQQHDAQA